MYDPTIGRWLNEDPSEYLGGDTNLYRYVHNSPTNLLDPSGLHDVEADGWRISGSDVNNAMNRAQSLLSSADMASFYRDGTNNKYTLRYSCLASDDPSRKAKYNWLAKTIAAGLRKMGAPTAATHFDHWASGKGNTDAPQIPVSLIQSYQGYKDALAGVKEQINNGVNKGVMSFSFQDAKDKGAADLAFTMGDFDINWEKKTDPQGKSTLCMSIKDPYDFHTDKDAEITKQKNDKTLGRQVGVLGVVAIPDATIVDMGKELNAQDYQRNLNWNEEL